MIYRLCKNVINSNNYGSYDEMMRKLDVFYLGNRITEAQYEELVTLLNEKEAAK